MKKFRLNTRVMLKNLFFSILISVTAFSMLLHHASAQNAEMRVINPHTGDTNFKFFSNITLVETRFNVTLDVRDVADLYFFQVLLEYDSSMLNATRAWIPEDDTEYVFHGENAISLGPYFYQDDPVYGTSVLVGGTLLGDISVVDVTGLFAIVEFEIVEEPNMGEDLSCNLIINNDDSFLEDSVGKVVQAIKTDGYYQFEWAAPLTYLVADPRIYEASELESFNITVWLNNTVTSQRSVYVEFQLSYSSTLLNVTHVFEGDFFAGFGDTIFNYTMEAGKVIVEIRLENYSSFPEGDGQIAIITFQGIYQDIEERYSSLKFVALQLLNDNGEDVTVVPRDGAYEITKATDLEITLDLYSDNWVKSDNKYIVIKGAEVIINGSVTPVKEGANVTIYYLVSGGKKELAYTKTDSNGRYSYIWITDLLGQLYQFQASWEEGLDVVAESDLWSYLDISTKQKSELTITVQPNTVVVGRNATIKGTIKEFEITTHTPVNVTIYYRLENETNGWIELVTVKTDREGHYNHQWTVQELGTYVLKASWPGDLPLWEGDESEVVNLKVVETAPVDILTYLPYILVGVVIVAVVVVLYLKKFRKP